VSAGDDDGAWFAAKRYGYGAGLPIRWQGWALLLGFLAAILLMARLLAPRHPLIFIAVSLTLTAGLVLVTALHTRGGWRWRWGDRDEA
jgi:hypothetical protein